MPKQVWDRPFRLRLAAGTRVLPPTVQVVVFLLLFQAVLALVTLIGGPLFLPGWTPGTLIFFWAFGLVLVVGFTALLVRMVVRGWVIAPFVLAVLGGIGALNLLASLITDPALGFTMLDALRVAADVLLVVFVWTPSARAYGVDQRAARKPAPRLPYRYDGPAPRREDFTAN